MPFRKRIVITGLGVLSPVGNNVNEFWQNLVNGKSGISRANFDLGDSPCQVFGQIKNFNPEDHLDKKILRRTDKHTWYALVAAKEAIEDAGLLKDEGKIDKDRVGVIIGSGIGGAYEYPKGVLDYHQYGRRKVNPNFISMIIADTPAAYVAIEYGYRGPNYATVSACASSAHAIVTGIMHLLLEDADVMIVGGAESALHPVGIAGFTQINALSTHFNDQPEKASRPFDKLRDGFVMAEGAGILVLETLEHAMKRGAKIYAEIVGYGVSDDAYHPVAPCENGEGAALAMKRAIESAGIKPEDVQLINAHGTSTPLGDVAETRAIKLAFGEHAYKLKVNSTKSMTGHLLGAAGAVEAIAVTKMIETKIIHPTINQEVPDPECDLDYVPNKAIEMEVMYAISNSFGFGGHNVSILFKRFEGK